MNSILKRFAFLLVVSSMLVLSVGCKYFVLDGTKPDQWVSCLIQDRMGVEKTEYEYGERITINISFYPYIADNEKSLYSAKLEESPYYEIVSDNPVQNISFDYDEREYEASFIIIIKEPCDQIIRPRVLLKLIDDDGYLFNRVAKSEQWQEYFSGDSEYPYVMFGENLEKGVRFSTDSNGIKVVK